LASRVFSALKIALEIFLYFYVYALKPAPRFIANKRKKDKKKYSASLLRCFAASQKKGKKFKQSKGKA
jgi:hypothetical protein